MAARPGPTPARLALGGARLGGHVGGAASLGSVPEGHSIRSTEAPPSPFTRDAGGSGTSGSGRSAGSAGSGGRGHTKRSSRLPVAIDLFDDSDFILDVSKLHIGREIGRGNYSNVFEGTYAGVPVAIKRQALTEPDAEKYLRAELAILRSLDDPHLVKYYGAALAPGSSRTREVLIVTELLDCGELREVLARPADELPVSWPRRARIARDILSGIAYLHAHGLIHRDIKTANVLLDHEWRAVLCDLGFARKTESSKVMTMCGTPEFMAPEVIFGEFYDEKADVFSFGMVLAELCTRRVPGEGGFLERQPRTSFKIDEDALREAMPSDCPPSLVELTVQCCAYEAEYRLSTEEAKEWLDDLCAELGEDEVASALSPVGVRRRPATGAGDGAGSSAGSEAGSSVGEGGATPSGGDDTSAAESGGSGFPTSSGIRGSGDGGDSSGADGGGGDGATASAGGGDAGAAETPTTPGADGVEADAGGAA